MKNLLLTSILLLSFLFSYSQAENPFEYLKIDNGQLIYENIFIKDSLKAAEIETLLMQQLPTANGITNIKSINGTITCSIVDLIVNYKKFGGTALGTAMFLNDPMNANASIFIKDGKYKVVVSNMVFDLTVPIGYTISHIKATAESTFLKNESTEFKTRENLVEAGNYLELQFNDIFTIKPIKSDW